MAEMVKATERVRTIQNFLNGPRVQGELQKALRGTIKADTLVRVMLTEIARNPKLSECTPQSLASCLVQCASLNLEPNAALGQAYLVPFKDQCQLIIGYRGLITLAYRSNLVGGIEAFAVYDGEPFEYDTGRTPPITHRRLPPSQRGDLIAAYAKAVVKEHPVYYLMWREELDEHRKKHAKAGRGGPWDEFYEEMCQKTVLRMLCSKRLPAGITDDLSRGLTLDAAADECTQAAYGPSFDDAPPAKPKLADVAGAADAKLRQVQAEHDKNKPKDGDAQPAGDLLGGAKEGH